MSNKGNQDDWLSLDDMKDLQSCTYILGMG